MEQALQVIFSATFIASVLRVATPLILPALGGLISELGRPSAILRWKA